MCLTQLCEVRNARVLSSETWLTCLFEVLTKTAYLALQLASDSYFSAHNREDTVVPGRIQIFDEKVNS